MAAIGTTTAQSIGVGDTTPDQTQQNKNQVAGQLPYMQVNNTDNIIPLTKQAANPATNGAQQPAIAQPPSIAQPPQPSIAQPPQQVTDTTQGNDAVLRAAQNSALNQGANPLAGLLTSQTSKYVKDPNLGFDYKKYNQSALEDYDRQQSQAMEAARQKLAGTSQSGELQNQYLQNQMTASAGRQELSAKNDYAAAQANQTNMINALAAGRATQAGNDTSDTSRIKNLIDVRGAGEGERAQKQGFQDNVALTKMGFDHDTQMAAQQHGYNLETMSKQFGNEMAKLLATQDFEGAQAQLQRDFQAAAQTKDINATAANIQKQLDFDKWKQENGQEFTAAQTAINNALQLSLKNMDMDLQYNLMNIKARIDEKALLTAQDFEAVQNALNREQQLAIQKNDTASQIQIETLKGQIAQQAQDKQNEFTKTLTSSTQAWQTGENIRKEDADKYMQALDIASREAIDKNDTETQKFIASEKNKLELAIQTQGMAQEEKMAYLTSALADARANNDVGRQKDIIGFQTSQALEIAANQGTIDQAKIQLKGDIDKALADKDFVKAEALQSSEFAWRSNENAKDRAITQAAQNLKEKGYNIDLLMEGIRNGSISPDAGLQMLANVGRDLGVKVSPPDPLQEQKAAQANYNMLQYQYSLSHPGSLTYVAADSGQLSLGGGRSITLTKGQALTPEEYNAVVSANPSMAKQQMTPEALSDFNDFMNQATSGKAITDSSNTQDIVTDIVANPNSWIGANKAGSPNNAAYQKAFGEATTWTYPGSNLDSNGYTFAGGIPSPSTMFKKDGKLYVASSGPQTQKRSGAPDRQYFTAIDVVTGQTINIST